eukprot:6178896-Pleurochrysis_carterae.AAC.1
MRRPGAPMAAARRASRRTASSLAASWQNRAERGGGRRDRDLGRRDSRLADRHNEDRFGGGVDGGNIGGGGDGGVDGGGDGG